MNSGYNKMDLSSPAVRNLDNHHERSDNITSAVRLRRRVPSPFVYATSPIPLSFRGNMTREEQIKHRLDTVNNVSRLISPISLATLRKMPGTHQFEPSELNPTKENIYKRSTLSAQQFQRDVNMNVKNNYKNNLNNENQDFKLKFSLQNSQYKQPRFELTDFLYPNGKSKISRTENQFLYSTRSIKSGAIFNENGVCDNIDSNYSKSISRASSGRSMRSTYLQNQLKILSKPKLIPNFETNIGLQNKQSTSIITTDLNDKIVYPRNMPTPDVASTHFKVNAVSLKPKDYRIFQHHFDQESGASNFQDIQLSKTSSCKNKIEIVQKSKESNKPFDCKSGEVMCQMASSTLNFLEKSITGKEKYKKGFVKVCSDSPLHHAVSVKNPTAQTVVLLRNQTNTYLRNAISSKLVTYEQCVDNSDQQSSYGALVVPSTISNNILEEAIANPTPAVNVTSTVAVPECCSYPLNHVPVISASTTATDTTAAKSSTSHLALCGSPKQIEMDSGNGTDEDELVVREPEDLREIGSIYKLLNNGDGNYDAENDGSSGESHEEDRASESSGLPESDEDHHSSLSEDEESQSNEEAIVTNATQSKASISAEGSSDADLSEPEQLSDELNDSRHGSANEFQRVTCSPQSFVEQRKDFISTGTDMQLITGEMSRSATVFPPQRPHPPQLPYTHSSSPSFGRTAMFSPFHFRSFARSPLIPSQGNISIGSQKSTQLEPYKDVNSNSESSVGTTSFYCFKPGSTDGRVSDVPKSSSPAGMYLTTDRCQGSKNPESITTVNGTITSTVMRTDPHQCTASSGSVEVNSTQTLQSFSGESQSDTQACCELVTKEVTAQKKTRRQTSNRQGHDKLKTHPALIASLFPNVPPVLRFVDEGQKLESLPWEFRRLLRWRASMLTPAVVRQALLRSGFRVSKLTTASEDLETIESSDWIFYFGKHMRPQVFRTIKEYQKVNHLPCSFQLGRKDRLWKNLVHMQMRCGKENFNYIPQTFCLPTDLEALKKVWDEEGANQRWILKPPASARGIGVRLITKWAQVPKKRPAIVQRYLAKPFLINDSKFDLRIYVYISSINPLRVYIHEDGLVRFASQKYTNSIRCLGNRFIHLTNYSINRLNSEYVSNTNDMATKGHKWSLRALWAYLREQGISPAPVWSSIKDVVVKTAISTEAAFNAAISSYCNHSCSVHEVFGFDIFLDEDLQPWLLEVNVSPSMHSDSPLDAKIKGNMVRDMLNIAGLRLPEPSDTSSHTVIPSCLTKTAPSRNSSLGNASPQPQIDPGGIPVNPLAKTPLSGSQNNLAEAGHLPECRLKCSGDTEQFQGSRMAKKIRSPSHEWLIDSRLHMTQLSSDEREKRRYYVLRAIQYELPRSSAFSSTPSHVNLSPGVRSCDLALGTANNNFQSQLDKSRVNLCQRSGALSSQAPHITLGGLEEDQSDRDSTYITPQTLHMYQNGYLQTASIHSTPPRSSSASSSSNEGNDDGESASSSDTVELSGSDQINGANNSSKKTARSMGIGPSSPDLRSHRVTGPTAQVPLLSTGPTTFSRETPSKPPTAPPQIRERASSKNSMGRTGIVSGTPTHRTRFRCASSGRNCEAPSPVRPQTLPRVRLASATADILECLTPSDVRILIEMVDELERAGGFECIFPPTSAGLAVRYLSYFESPRYANLLCIAYLQKYSEDKEKGIELLRKLCEKNVHLSSSIQGDQVLPENQWQDFMKRRNSSMGNKNNRKLASPKLNSQSTIRSSTPSNNNNNSQIRY